MTGHVSGSEKVGLFRQMGSQLAPSDEKPLASTARVMTNIGVAPAFPFVFSGAALGILLAKIAHEDPARGARVGSIAGGAFGSIVTGAPLITQILTASFYSTRGVRDHPKGERKKMRNLAELLHKTWRNTFTIPNTCFPAQSSKINLQMPLPLTLNDQAKEPSDHPSTCRSFVDTYQQFIATQVHLGADAKSRDPLQLHELFPPLQSDPYAAVLSLNPDEDTSISAEYEEPHFTAVASETSASILKIVTVSERLEQSGNLFKIASELVFSDTERFFEEYTLFSSSFETTPTLEQETMRDTVDVFVISEGSNLGSSGHSQQPSASTSGSSVVILLPTEYRRAFEEVKADLCLILDIPDARLPILEIKKLYQERHLSISVPAQIELERRINRLEEMEFLLNGVPHLQDLTKDLFAKGSTILRNIGRRGIDKISIDAKLFLKNLGYVENVMPRDFTQVSEANINAIRNNLIILFACVDIKGPYAVINAAKASAETYYLALEPTMCLLKYAILLKLGLKGGLSCYTIEELQGIYKTKVPLLERDRDLENLFDDMVILNIHRIRDSQMGLIKKKQKNVGQPTAAAMFFSKIYRELEDTKTLIELYDRPNKKTGS